MAGQILNPNLLLAVPLAPLAGSMIAGLFGTSFFGNVIGRKTATVATILGVLVAFGLSLQTLLAVNMNFIAFSHYLGDAAGQIFVFFILTVAAAESAIGLAILVVMFRNLDTINVEDLDRLKG